MTYAEKLLDPRWQKKRLTILNRDQWKCRRCGNDKLTLHVHHLTYLPGVEPWDCPDDTLVTLCNDCHEKDHGLHPRTRQFPPWPLKNTGDRHCFGQIIALGFNPPANGDSSPINPWAIFVTADTESLYQLPDDHILFVQLAQQLRYASEDNIDGSTPATICLRRDFSGYSLINP